MLTLEATATSLKARLDGALTLGVAAATAFGDALPEAQ